MDVSITLTAHEAMQVQAALGVRLVRLRTYDTAHADPIVHLTLAAAEAAQKKVCDALYGDPELKLGDHIAYPVVL